MARNHDMIVKTVYHTANLKGGGGGGGGRGGGLYSHLVSLRDVMESNIIFYSITTC